MIAASLELIGRKKYSCKYPGCNNHYYTNIKGNYINKHFFRFPRNVQYHQIWRNVCNVERSKNTTNWTICEDHFSRQDFMNDEKKHLIHNAVPLPCLSEISSSGNSNFLEVVINEEVNSRKNLSGFGDIISSHCSCIRSFAAASCSCLILPVSMNNKVTSKLHNLQDHNYCKFWQS